jgi:hypothetical protein
LSGKCLYIFWDIWNILYPFGIGTYFMAILNIWRPFGIFYGYLVYFVGIRYIFSRFGILYQDNLATRKGRKILARHLSCAPIRHSSK